VIAYELVLDQSNSLVLIFTLTVVHVVVDVLLDLPVKQLLIERLQAFAVLLQ